VRLSLVAVGRLKDGPERDLLRRYAERVDALGRGLGFGKLDAVEVPESRARRDVDRRADEAAGLSDVVGTAATIAFDERGALLTSEALAARIGAWRDEGRAGVAAVIGGADGFDRRVLDRADLALSFGRLTLPHQLVRVLVVEQLYRALTILAGHPYHRGRDGDS